MEALGLPAQARVPFLFHPAADWSPVVISCPHVGLTWPHDLRPKPQVDLAKNADFAVHELYRGSETRGAARVEAVYSRLVVDLNRARDDISRLVVPDHPAPHPRTRPGVPEGPELPGARTPRNSGRGVVWTRAVDNTPVLSRALSHEELQWRLTRFHDPYYAALEHLLERRRERFGYAILLDAHSMPGIVDADLVLGTLDGDSCSHTLESRAFAALSDFDAVGNAQYPLRVRRNRPYRGGEVVRRFGRPAEGFHALQLEVNRSLYMDETHLRSFVSPARPLPNQPRDHGAPALAPDRARALATLEERIKRLVSSLVGA